MFTLLPYADFNKTAQVFGKNLLLLQIQTVDAIMGVLHQVNDEESPHINTPGVLMWKGYEPQLCMLGLALCEEGAKRGYSVRIPEEHLEYHLDAATCASFTMRKPEWCGDILLHESHQSRMMSDDSRYISFFKDVEMNLPMVWPVLK